MISGCFAQDLHHFVAVEKSAVLLRIKIQRHLLDVQIVDADIGSEIIGEGSGPVNVAFD